MIKWFLERLGLTPKKKRKPQPKHYTANVVEKQPMIKFVVNGRAFKAKHYFIDVAVTTKTSILNAMIRNKRR